MHTKSTVIKPYKEKEKEKNLTSSQKENANHWQRKDNETEADSQPVTEGRRWCDNITQVLPGKNCHGKSSP